MWGANDVVEGSKMREILQQMSDEHRFRKMLFVMDACYSGTIGLACEGIPGVLMITAANPYDPSKADIFDHQMNIWLSNGFTRAFQETIDKNTDINMRELYYELARHTTPQEAMPRCIMLPSMATCTGRLWPNGWIHTPDEVGICRLAMVGRILEALVGEGLQGFG